MTAPAIAKPPVVPIWPRSVPGLATRSTPRWPRALVLALADYHCAVCHGAGWRQQSPCLCVGRRIFRECLERAGRKSVWRVSKTGPLTWSRKDSEFAADLLNVARSANDERDWMVLHLARFVGVDYVAGRQLTGLDKGTWFARLYAAEAAAGEACFLARPYALYPIDEYFTHGTRRTEW
jgi:hypothetical protein